MADSKVIQPPGQQPQQHVLQVPGQQKHRWCRRLREASGVGDYGGQASSSTDGPTGTASGSSGGQQAAQAGHDQAGWMLDEMADDDEEVVLRAAFIRESLLVYQILMDELTDEFASYFQVV